MAKQLKRCPLAAVHASPVQIKLCLIMYMLTQKHVRILFWVNYNLLMFLDILKDIHKYSVLPYICLLQYIWSWHNTPAESYVSDYNSWVVL